MCIIFRKYKNWEKDRRDRLNVAFGKLATTISGSTPPIKKIDIIIKACDCIARLRTEVEKLKQDSGIDTSILGSNHF
jgi:Helix-loop-helix DNA-binding domain